MPDISTANQDRISAMCPMGYEFSMGGRISYLTTAGALSSATITAPTITSGTITDGTFTSALIQGYYAQYAGGAATGTTDIAGLDAMTAGWYLLDPNNASGNGFHLTSAGGTGVSVRLINIATGATAIVGIGATENAAAGAYIASSTAYFNFTIRAGGVVDLMFVSATRSIIVGGTANISGFGVTT